MFSWLASSSSLLVAGYVSVAFIFVHGEMYQNLGFNSNSDKPPCVCHGLPPSFYCMNASCQCVYVPLSRRSRVSTRTLSLKRRAQICLAAKMLGRPQKSLPLTPAASASG
ncbi:hypothetical protein BD311DRAFT_154991 [Dichomitus squalens]|uniref:Uncharacterized protein n=1 Tax=Dichomitus squalens TaxID=114155 RepID=A0A4Q9M8Q1_9APHY|nr:hypothetical protein BD311DRAFT_154991 [Dichomitus squalens]